MKTEQDHNLREALPLFLLRCDAESTKVAYEREIRRFLSWLNRPEVGCCARYVEDLRERGLSPTTVRWRATVARVCFFGLYCFRPQLWSRI